MAWQRWAAEEVDHGPGQAGHNENPAMCEEVRLRYPWVDNLPADLIPPPPPLADSTQPDAPSCRGVVQVGGAAGAALVLALVLAPGLAYRVGRERRLPERKRQGAADSASLLVAGATSTALALWGFAALRGLMPTHTPDVGKLMDAPGDYAAAHLPYVAAWATGIYAVAFVLAAAEGRFGLLARLTASSRLGGRLRGISHESAWWLAFKPDPAKQLDEDPSARSATFVLVRIDRWGLLGWPA